MMVALLRVGVTGCLLLGAVMEAVIGAEIDKSGVTPNTISLPEGPGSIEGLGESFQPMLNTGTGRYVLPIQVPPGTAGHQPTLGLSYDGGRGNGPLGFGWRMPYRFIQRQTDKGIPQYVDDVSELTGNSSIESLDIFLNEQMEELVHTQDDFYFAENETAFIRYQRVGEHWEGRLPDGTLLEFGLTEAARVVHPDHGKPFKWLLERETDTHGNQILYQYRRFDGEQDWHQIYCSKVTYGPGSAPWQNYHFVLFSYEARDDWFEDCRSGFPIRTGHRLRQVTVGTQAWDADEAVLFEGHRHRDEDGDGRTDNLNRIYDLTYLDDERAYHWSLLTSVTVFGSDGETSLPATRIEYGLCEPPDRASAAGEILGGQDEPTAVMDNALVDLVDLNGDALPDLLRTGGNHRAFLNRGERIVDGERRIAWQETALDVGGEAGLMGLSSDQVHLSDLDGNGLADLVSISGVDDSYAFYNLGDLDWGERQRLSLPGGAAPPAPKQSDRRTRTADVNFDKQIDLIQGDGRHYFIWYSLGDSRYSEKHTVPGDSFPGFGAPFDFERPGVEIADFNGDRVPDLVSLRAASELVVTAGLGYGRFAPPVAVPIPQSSLDPLVLWRSEYLGKAKLVDITSDGLVDLVVERAFAGESFYWINLGNYHFDEPRVVSDMPTGWVDTPALRWADLNGNGTTDLVYADSQSLPRITTVDLGRAIGCPVALHQMTRLDNGIGGNTRLEYETSTHFRIADDVAGRPWPNPMPFPVEVITRIINDDSLGHEYVTELRFHDGYYDGEEKEFRGFARVEQLEVGDAEAPGLATFSVFDTGAQFEVMKGKLLQSAAFTAPLEGFPDPSNVIAFSETDTAWAIRELHNGQNGITSRFAHPARDERRILEEGRGEPKTVLSEFDYDEFGNEIRNAQFGIVEGEDRSAFDDERVIVTEYALNRDEWIVRLPRQVEVQDETGFVVSRTQNYYDDPTFAADNLGNVAVGDLTLIREWVDPADPATSVDSIRTQYDSFGNPIAILDALADVDQAGTIDFSEGHGRLLVFDEQFRALPITEEIKVGGGSDPLFFKATYDPALGVIGSSQGPNGHDTVYQYDALSRLIGIIRPDGDPNYPTMLYNYGVAIAVEGGGVVNYVETMGLDRTPGGLGNDFRGHYLISREYVDGMGRKLMTRREAEPAPGETNQRVVVDGAVTFNARGEPFAILNPHFSSLSNPDVDVLLDYESIEAADWSGWFHEGEQGLVELQIEAAHRVRSFYDALVRPIRVLNIDETFQRKIHEPLIAYSYDENDTSPDSEHFDTPMGHHQDGLERLVRVDEIVRLNDDGTPRENKVTWITRYGYNLHDQLTQIVDSQNNLKVFEYDGLKRKVFMDDPNRGVMHWRFDALGNLVEREDAKGQITRYTYDGVNRILTEDFVDEGLPFSQNHRYHPSEPLGTMNRPDVAYFYDVPVPDLDLGDASRETARNALGRLAYVWDLSGESHFAYDSRDRLDWEVKRLPDPEKGVLISYLTGFQYDSLDRITRIRYPDRDSITYGYNERGLLQQVGGGEVATIVAAMHHFASGKTLSVEYGNQVGRNYGFDQRGRLNSLVTSLPAFDSRVIDYQYAYDFAHNMLEIQDRRELVDSPEGEQRRDTRGFEYDNLYRLTGLQYSGDEYIDYRYDRIGNMVWKGANIDRMRSGYSLVDLRSMSYGGVDGAWNRGGRGVSGAGPHGVTAVDSDGGRTFGYDRNGNMSSKDGIEFSWNFRDQLAAVSGDENAASYTYDFLGRRVTRTVVRKNPVASASGGSATDFETTQYPSKYFEVRPHGLLTKYVWVGASRVYRVLGWLNNEERIVVQHFPLVTGWNVFCLRSSVESGLFLPRENSPISLAFVVQHREGNPVYEAIAENSVLPRGTVVWLKATEASVISALGSAGGDNAEAVPLLANPGHLPIRWKPRADSRVWRYMGEARGWFTGADDLGTREEAIAKWFKPGDVGFSLEQSGRWEREFDEGGIYFHLDHLGNAIAQTNDRGELVTEIAYFPFGGRRLELRFDGGIPVDTYGYSQKEQDRETGFNYFEARFQTGDLCRFVSVDPIMPALTTPDILSEPQRLNYYAYAMNRPLTRIDPTGTVDVDYDEIKASSLEEFEKVLTKNLEQYVEDRKGNGFDELAVADVVGRSLGTALERVGKNLLDKTKAELVSHIVGRLSESKSGAGKRLREFFGNDARVEPFLTGVDKVGSVLANAVTGGYSVEARQKFLSHFTANLQVQEVLALDPKSGMLRKPEGSVSLRFDYATKGRGRDPIFRFHLELGASGKVGSRKVERRGSIGARVDFFGL